MMMLRKGFPSKLLKSKRVFSSFTAEAILGDYASVDRKFHASSFKSIDGKLWDLKLAFRTQRLILQMKAQNFSTSSSSSTPDNCPGSDALSVAFGVGKMFTEQAIEYAIGGSLALGVWSTPRATANVDMNVFANSNEECLRVIDCLSSQPNVTLVREHESHDGISREEAVHLAGTKKEIHVLVDGVHMGIFLPKTTLEAFANQRKKLLTFGSESFYFLDAETIVTYKLLWKRPKDLADVDGLFQVFAKIDQPLDVEFISNMIQLHTSGTDDVALVLLRKMSARYPYQVRGKDL
jgi:hypothetical protein